MCMHIYIAADVPLTVVSYDCAKPGFHVEEVKGACRQSLSSQFNKPYIYTAGTNQGCSCGFEYGYDGRTLLRGTSEDERSREMVDALSEYLALSVRRYGPVELYACWSGDETKSADSNKTITPENIGGVRFRFEERQHLLVRLD
jgi:hypothetical protein